MHTEGYGVLGVIQRVDTLYGHSSLTDFLQADFGFSESNIHNAVYNILLLLTLGIVLVHNRTVYL